MKKFFALIFAGIILLTTAASAFSATYVGNVNSKKFHYSDCASVAKMKPAHKVILSSREEAIKKGYVPCKRCSP